MASNAGSITLRTVSSQSQTGNVSTGTTDSTPTNAVGSWLCAEGPYQDYIAALSKSNPGLAKPDPNNKDNPLKKGHALVVLLELPTRDNPSFSKTEFTPKGLKDHFLECSRDDNRNHRLRRIYIMEGLAPDYVSMVGGHFFMEPSFFQRHERTCVWSNEFTPVSDALPQPSSLDPKTTFHLQYCELREFNMPLATKAYFCSRTKRHVGVTTPRRESTIAIVRRKIGWWSRKSENGGWDVVILCDPELGSLTPTPKLFVEGDRQGQSIENIEQNLKNTPFQGGYVDFLPSATFERAKAHENRGIHHPHRSMLRDLMYYFEHHSNHIDESKWNEPQTSSFFVKKIVAAHSMQLVDYIKIMLPSLELKLATAWEEEQEHWKALQLISRRCGNYRDDVEDTLFSLGYSLETPTGRRGEESDECEKDFQYVYLRLKVLKERTDSLMQAMTGLASIAGNRQNLEEARRVQRLTGLALFFVPLAYASSLFSMQDEYAPSGRKFWVYWLVAIGTVAVTFGFAMVLNNALDAEAQWTLGPLGFLNFWSSEKDLKKVKRSRSIYERGGR